MLGNILNALMQPGQGGQQNAGTDALSQVIGGLMGGQQSGAAPVTQLLNGLQQLMQSKPGTAATSSSPLMGLLGPVANAVASQLGISTAAATTVAATAMHSLVSDHAAAGGTGNITQSLSSGTVPQAAVNSVVQATGLTPDEAQKSLKATMNHFQEHAQQHAANLAAGKKRRDG